MDPGGTGINDPLSEAERLFDAALNGMPHGFSMWSEDWRLLLWNKRFQEIYEYRSLARGMTLVEVCQLSVANGHCGENSAQTVAEAYLAGVAAGIFHEDVMRGRPIRLRHRHMPGVGWVITHEDIAELKERESELEHQHMRLKAAVNNISHGLSMFDAGRRLVICNNRYAEIYGLPPEIVKPGAPHEEIVSYRLSHGMRGAGGPEAFLRQHEALLAGGVTDVVSVEMNDGRSISITHHPMADGGWVSTHQDITEQRQNEAKIRHFARHDPLTDLPNRMHFLERMESAEAHIRRGEQMAVLYIDLDRFKPVNDTLGHAAGDAVLVQVSRRLAECCREVDVVARIGGDEFALLIGPLHRAQDAAPLAERIVGSLSRPFPVDGRMMEIGASVGIAVAPSDGNDTDTLMKSADVALYRAKNRGGGFCFHDESLTPTRRLSLLTIDPRRGAGPAREGAREGR
jgi:diguanylate cyclase (GGDEF)-like protein